MSSACVDKKRQVDKVYTVSQPLEMGKSVKLASKKGSASSSNPTTRSRSSAKRYDAVPAKAMRASFSEKLSRVAFNKERIIVERNGKSIAAVVPLEDLRALEAIEDASDVREAAKVLRRIREGREAVLAWHEAKKVLS
jgi:antitoxin (DNA-binding transcriptional repressor) of toxin-antitoxin stability system